MNIAQSLKPKGSLSNWRTCTWLTSMRGAQSSLARYSCHVRHHNRGNLKKKNVETCTSYSTPVLQLKLSSKTRGKFLSYDQKNKIQILKIPDKKKAQGCQNAVVPTAWARMNSGRITITMHTFLQADRCYSPVVVCAARIEINIYNSLRRLQINLPKSHHFFLAEVSYRRLCRLTTVLVSLTSAPHFVSSSFPVFRHFGLSDGIRFYVTNPRTSCCTGQGIMCCATSQANELDNH